MLYDPARCVMLAAVFGELQVLHAHTALTLRTEARSFLRIGARLQTALAGMLADNPQRNGLLNVFLAHTSASLCIQENTDPDVLLDLCDALDRLAPAGMPYRHAVEGPDDMPAHIKSMLTATQLSLPVRGGLLALGTWQEVYLIEHRAAPHSRRLELDFVGA
jgi:secondary thiamine-phosphate synthase enzyme